MGITKNSNIKKRKENGKQNYFPKASEQFDGFYHKCRDENMFTE